MDWYYSDGDEQRGPLNEEELRAAYDAGMVTPSTTVWREGMDAWQPLSTVFDLSGGTLTAAPTSPQATAKAVGGSPASAKSGGSSGRRKLKKRKAGGRTGATVAARTGASKAKRLAVGTKTGATRSPYDAPAADLAVGGQAGPVVLAGRMDRLIAIIIDVALGGIVNIPLIALVVKPSKGMLITVIALAVCLAIGLFIVQLRCVAKHSATLGKKMMKIYIADMQGTPATLGKIVGMRMFVHGLVCGIPFVGWLYAAADPWLIFRADRRCGHDLLAGTQVLKAQPAVG